MKNSKARTCRMYLVDLNGGMHLFWFIKYIYIYIHIETTKTLCVQEIQQLDHSVHWFELIYLSGSLIISSIYIHKSMKIKIKQFRKNKKAIHVW